MADQITLQGLAQKLAEKQGARGIREVAREIGISPATFSRLLRGHLPDIGTFGKICKWLEVDPAEVLGLRSKRETVTVSAHFRKNQTLDPKTAKALAQLILAAQRAIVHTQADSEDVR